MKTKHSYTYTGKNRGHLKKASCLRLCLSTLYLLHTYSHTHLCTDYFIVHLSYIHSIPNKKKIYTFDPSDIIVHWIYTNSHINGICSFHILLYNNMHAYVLLYSHKSLLVWPMVSIMERSKYLWAVNFITHSLDLVNT